MTYGNICISRSVYRVITLWPPRIVPMASESSRTFDFSDWRQRLFVAVWSARREAFPAEIRSGVPDLGTAPVRPFEDIPRREHSKGTRSIDAVRPTSLPASHRVFFRGSGPGQGDLFTWTIPPACFTIDSHDTSLALLRSLECYHLTFITARHFVVKFCSDY